MSQSNIVTKSLRPRLSSRFLFSLLSFVALAPILFLFPPNVYAVDVTLAWDANTEEDLAGYRVFYRAEGQNYNYNDPAWEGDKTETTCTIYNLDDHTTHCFVARAFDMSDNESADSNEVCYQPTPTNHAPVLDTIGPKTVEENSLLEFTITASDPDGDALTYSASSLPAGADFDPATQTFSWIPDYNDTGNYDVLFTVADNGSPLQSDSETVTITVGDANRPPVLDTIGPKTVEENSLLEFTITASDPDGDALTYSASSLPAGAGFDPATQTFSWTPDYNDTGNHDVLFTVADSGTPSQNDSETVTITVTAHSNLAPLQPVITSPYCGQVECGLLLQISTESFSDPDGDPHNQSQWQISKQENFDTLPIMDVTSTDHLTELPVPHAMLESEQTYYVRVRFYDDYGNASEWSDTVEFTTASNVNDSNANRIPDDQEVSYDVDLNEDGIADNDQPEVIKCVEGSRQTGTVGVCKVSDSITAIEAIEMIDPAEVSDKIRRPKKLLTGLFSYRLSVSEPGATATVKIYFSRDISKSTVFYKYDTINGWQDYSQHTTFNDDGRSINLELKDGGSGDSDGVANGSIVDPGALAEASNEVETIEGAGSYSDNDGGSESGGCFIATATFGSYEQPDVGLLGDFRAARILSSILLAGFALACLLRTYGRPVTGGWRS
jgi:hypothetical protein